MAGAIVFDVNETLLDLSALRPVFARLFDDADVSREWFGQLLQSSMTVSLTGDYQDFVAIGGGALTVVADRRGVELSDEGRAEIRTTMASLPPHADVAENLKRLKNAGLRLAALTNSPQTTATAQLSHAGVADLFDEILSVEMARRFKPAPEPYRAAATELGIATSEMWMVAAHDWDIAGAMGTGCKGALVMRPGVVINPIYQTPDIVGRDMHEVVDQLLAAEVGVL